MKAYSSKIVVRCGVALVGICGVLPVSAQVVSINIPSEQASRSIPELARQANIQILGPGEQLRSVITPEVKGTFDVTAALEMMLKGTD